jgi:hypothetical protein
MLRTLALATCVLASVEGFHPVALAQTQAQKPPVDENAKKKAMSVEDFLVDQSILEGEIGIKGSVACLSATMCSLYGGNMLASVVFNPEHLAREDRRRLLSCNPFSEPCVVSITGSGGSDFLHPFVASAIQWEPTDDELAARDPSLPKCDSVPIADIKAVAESSPFFKLASLTIIDLSISVATDPDGHEHCVAHIKTNAGAKEMRFYLKRERTGQLMIQGKWLF